MADEEVEETVAEDDVEDLHVADDNDIPDSEEEVSQEPDLEDEVD